jgi:hypothetical protein
MRELLTELRRPRLAPLIAAMSVVLLALWIANARLTVDVLRRAPLSAVLASENDDVTRAMWLVAQSESLRGPAVVAVGASAMREALETAPIMAARIDRMSPHAAAYLPLFTAGQTLTESLVLISALEAPPGSIVMVQLTPIRFAVTAAAAAAEAANPRLPLLDYASVGALLDARGIRPTLLPRILRARGYFANSMIQRVTPSLRDCLVWQAVHPTPRECVGRLLSQPWFRVAGPFRDHAYPDVARSIPDKMMLARQLALELSTRGDAAREFSPAVAARIEAICADRRWRLLWVRLPHDPLDPRVIQSIDREIDRMLANAGSPARDVLDLRDRFDESDDFYDLHHVRSAGRRILTDTILAHVGALSEWPSDGRR